MRRTLTVRHDRFPLRAPFRIARGVKTAADVVTVTIAEGDVRGWGEGVPYPRYGETIDGAIAAIDGVRALIEAGGTRQDLARAMPPGAARNAVDCALWDLEARLGRTDVATLASVPPVSALPSAITIGIDTPAAMAAIAATVAHVPLLKIKVNREEAAAQIAAVRAAAPAPRLIVDPNESWRAEDIAAHLPLLRAQRVDLLEQPVPANDDEGLAALAGAIPICADEALHTRDDLDRLAGRYSHVNVKLDKTGGLTEALALAGEARERGFGLMVGCMVCSSLGIAPAMLVASGADFVDLDGPLWLAQDRDGGARDSDGVLSAPVPGFWGTPACA
ncbi:N-acetyl-D-Glu racemase DgcA [Sphingomonas sp. S6]|jgi:L-alanine-DL-glutamate epimerase-like enolase superfamily enzyme|uniref:N-acetyl-D-Glu racemase DgcA n=1 Tax=Sphingomonas sp. S6 TaxID=3368600 RepID=UPI000FA67460|nr:N-acetyl-D-Glu racemase DgcA [uncultured Sphingomonas sp.]RTL14612.1 MAG: dipeptide epimerase [Sphingomonadaceae bacterium]